jgi:mono/diheme cytochrome c family protein
MVRRTRLLLALVGRGLLSALLGPAAVAQSSFEVGRGQFIAAERCAGCHAADTQTDAPAHTPAAPSLRALAARPNLTAARLKDLITTPKHPMPATPLGSADIAAVVAYIRSLR